MSAADASRSRGVAPAIAVAVAVTVMGGRAALEMSSARAADAGVRAADAGAPAGAAVDPEVRQMAMDFVNTCWHARWSNPELVDRCYAPEGRFRAVRVGE